MDRRLNDMTIEELTAELKGIKDNLRDLEEMHAFTFGKTSIHIGAEKAQNMQLEFEEDYRMYSQRILEIEKALEEKSRGASQNKENLRGGDSACQQP